MTGCCAPSCNGRVRCHYESLVPALVLVETNFTSFLLTLCAMTSLNRYTILWLITIQHLLRPH